MHETADLKLRDFFNGEIKVREPQRYNSPKKENFSSCVEKQSFTTLSPEIRGPSVHRNNAVRPLTAATQSRTPSRHFQFTRSSGGPSRTAAMTLSYEDKQTFQKVRG